MPKIKKMKLRVVEEKVEQVIVKEEVKRKPKRKKRRSKYNAAEEARLERLVFGDARNVITTLLERPNDPATCNDNVKTEAISDEYRNTSDNSDHSKSENEMHSDIEDYDHSDGEKKLKTAWVDEDDAQYSVKAALAQQHRKLPTDRPEKVYTELLENKFTQLVGTPKWASLKNSAKNRDDEDEDSDSEILKHSNHLGVVKVEKLRKGKIDIKALRDINKSTQTEGPRITSLEFHPTSTVAFVAGFSGVLSLFQIDGKENNKLHSLRFERFRIHCAKFLKEGSEIIVGARDSSYSQAYDLISGKTYKIALPHGMMNMQKFEVSPDGKFIAVAGRMGEIHLLSAKTKELVANFKMNDKCQSLAFTPDSSRLITHGDCQEMYVWDLNSRTCMHRAMDDGCIANSSVAVSPSGQFLATGSKQGAVNIYDMASALNTKVPTPLKIVLNLVTPITCLKFNPTSEVLAMASNYKDNAFKILHLASMSVFANFPTFQTRMHNPLVVDFSPASGYLGISNNKGNAYLYRLKHYSNY